MKKFTEKQTRDFYNHDDLIYRSFWDKEGNCHWGYFPNDNISFLQSMTELNKKMFSLANITDKSHVLDLGCGNGNNSFYIAKNSLSKVTGLDLSDTRIENAKDTLADSEKSIKKRIKFFQGSATKLPFKNSSFSHVWSQATIYHVHDKKAALKEVSRVLKKGGIFIFDDLIKPNKKIGEEARKLVYERLFFNTDYNLVSYQQELEKLGFRVYLAQDLSRHYAMSYWKLADIAESMIKKGKNKQFHEVYRKLIHAYRKTWGLMEKGDIGWALFLAKKIK
jgi:ubiquinone/menaquinone biosynthesis C-methylase UbiE